MLCPEVSSLQRQFLVLAAAAATSQHTRHLGITELRAWDDKAMGFTPISKRTEEVNRDALQEPPPCSSMAHLPLSMMQPSLMTRIWSALTTVESLRSQTSVTYYPPSKVVHSASHTSPAVLYLCATTIVVRLVQTLAREAWMALSLDVSSADVAYGKSVGETVMLPRESRRGGCRCLVEVSRTLWGFMNCCIGFW